MNKPLMPIEDALAAVRGALPPMQSETISLSEAHGRVLAAPVQAKQDQPLTDRSAMDGYAVRAEDVSQAPVVLVLTGHVSAGGAATHSVGPGQAVRIFTGAVVPEGADVVVIQENCETSADGSNSVRVLQSAQLGANIRPAGSDFHQGDLGLTAGIALSARDILVAAGMNWRELPVSRKPKVALIATGDELVSPGTRLEAHQTISSSLPALETALKAWGAQPISLGIAPDQIDEIAARLQSALDGGADMIVTLGGASVGDHDLVHKSLSQLGFKLDFWKIAMKPGKPMLHGFLGKVPVIGLPGNPVSSMICALLFVRSAIHASLGRSASPDTDALGLPTVLGMLAADLPANGERHDFLRARLTFPADDPPTAWPLNRQDSAQTLNFATAECLIQRTPFSQPSKAGELYPINPLKGLF